MKAGQYTGVKLTLENLNQTATAMDVTLVHIIDDDSPFTHAKPQFDMPIKSLRAGDPLEVTLSINTNKFAKPGLYPFYFRLHYFNGWRDQYSREYMVHIRVENDLQDTSLTVRTSAADNVSAVAGRSFTLPIYVMNTGDFYARDILVTVEGLSQDTFILSSGTNRVNFDQVNGGSYKKFDLNLTAAQGLKTASYPLAFKVEYTTEAGEKISEKQEIWIP